MSLDDSKIEQLKKRLYSNTDNLPPPHRGKLHPHAPLVNSSWDAAPEDTNHTFKVEDTERSYKGFSPKFIKPLLGIAALVLVAAIGIAAYIFINGGNFISPDNIDIKMLGPVATPAGEELSLDIDITNQNNTNMVLTDLILTYPEGTRQAGDRVTSMVSARVPIGTIKAKETVRKTVKSILFGEENVRKNIRVTIEYRVPDSDTIFVKEKDFPIFIGSSPITLNVDALKEITANQDATFSINVVSNSASVVKGVVLKADYPFGFQYQSSDLQPIAGNNVWNLGDIAPGATRKIVVKGKIVGENDEDRVFRFYAGTENTRDQSDIGTIFVNTSASVAVRKPFLGADISLDGAGTSVFVGTAGNPVKGEITWQNNLDVPINDIVIEAKVTGDMLDKSSVEGDRGFYRSLDSTILWDKTTLEDLKEIAPGQVGRVQFSLASLYPSQQVNSNFRRPSLYFDLTIKGKRLNEDNVPQEIKSSVSREIKIASGLTLNSILVRSIGPFNNTGPLPPKADKETTYTVMVSVLNSFNTAKGVVYTATLPAYVKWLGKVYPEDSAVTYNADKREITVSLGDIGPGVGYTSTAKQFGFQVVFQPSISQIGTSPVVINAQRIAGKDSYADVIVESTVGPRDIKIEEDPEYKYGQDKVAQ
ncbi:MAG: hypothetical protein RL094_4 [Candidatus Parcubacteria bacterium]|jgi:hypothetical protein